MSFRSNREKYMEVIRDFRLIDDDFMSKVFEDKACAELLLHIILEDDTLEVVEAKSQYEIKNLQGRSVRLDILAKDATGKYFNVEVQRSDQGAVAKRARYNSSLLDANIAHPGDEYQQLGATYVIFITEKDVLKGNLPIYHIDRMVRETGELFPDEAHILYVNSQIQDQTRLGLLMQDFYRRNPEDMHYNLLRDRSRHFKSEEGANSMCRAVEKLVEEGRDEGRDEMWLSEKMLVYKKLLKMGYSDEQMLDFMEVTPAELERVKKAAAEA